MSPGRWLGVPAEDLGAVRRLAFGLSLTTAAEILAEGAVLSAFLARVGASGLPTALALRAVAEVVLSLGFERALAHQSPSRAMRLVSVAGAVLFVAMAAAFSSAAGVYAAFVVATAMARIKAIHFGVLTLAALPSAARSLPLVQAGGRLGGVAAGPLLALGGPGLGPMSLSGIAAGLYALSFAFMGSSSAAPPSAAPSSETERDAPTAPGLLPAIVIGAIALALGRLALVTQSGAILEAAYGEADLNRVLGVYFTGANLLAFLLQALVVGRVLGAGGLPLLNTGWSLLYLAAQAWLSLGPAAVWVALSARLVESELRNALRTPVASLLYEAIPAARRASARTLVIGVAVPVASLAGGLGLGFAKAHPTVLSCLGLAAAATLVASAWAQNRAYGRYFRAAAPGDARAPR